MRERSRVRAVVWLQRREERSGKARARSIFVESVCLEADDVNVMKKWQLN